MGCSDKRENAPFPPSPPPPLPPSVPDAHPCASPLECEIAAVCQTEQAEGSRVRGPPSFTEKQAGKKENSSRVPSGGAEVLRLDRLVPLLLMGIPDSQWGVGGAGGQSLGTISLQKLPLILQNFERDGGNCVSEGSAAGGCGAS